MTEISRDEVQHLAGLSSISLSEDELDSLATDLARILAYVDQLSELDTEGVEPTYLVTDRENVWRNDEIIDEGIGVDDLLAVAPDSLDHQVKVPKVL